ncbi:MAG: nucleotidyl transferase AbiEii/AbiGii toxin family protein [Oscillospiraceae bacterium]|nr:nucleotidyl transferase AbiEii/AbiGii toxin family protein [Oscillospiraceae bacterium]
MKTSMQLKAKTRNLSATSGIPPHIIQRNYFLERFLERLSLSSYKNSIVLKGGVLITSILGIEARSTMDLDATMRARALPSGDVLSDVLAIVDEILRTPIDDSVTFTVVGTEETRVEAEYPGCRVTLGVTLDKLRDTVKIDFTAGDVITPSPIEYGYKLMFEDREINVLAYNLETVLAEKFIAVLSFDVINSRMKDFYDIHMLVSGHGGSVSQDVFVEALRNTAGQRQMLRYVGQAGEIIDTIAGNPAMSDLWKRYSATNQYAADIGYESVISALRILTQWIAASQ